MMPGPRQDGPGGLAPGRYDLVGILGSIFALPAARPAPPPCGRPPATPGEALDTLAAAISEIAGVPDSAVTPGTHLTRDLGLDSLSLVEVAVAAENAFGTEIPDEKLRDLATVQDIITCVAPSTRPPRRQQGT